MQAWLGNPMFTASKSFKLTHVWLSSGDQEALQALMSHHLKRSSIFEMSVGAVADRCGDAGLLGPLSRSNWNQGWKREREREGQAEKGSSAHPQSTGFNSLRVDSRSVHRLLSAALHIKDMNSGRTGTGKWETQRRWREEGVNRVGSIIFLVSFFFKVTVFIYLF